MTAGNKRRLGKEGGLACSDPRAAAVAPALRAGRGLRLSAEPPLVGKAPLCAHRAWGCASVAGATSHRWDSGTVNERWVKLQR